MRADHHIERSGRSTRALQFCAELAIMRCSSCAERQHIKAAGKLNKIVRVSLLLRRTFDSIM